MAGRTAIVIAVDGLRASALGAYGNTWHGTPAFDALAAESLVVDWMWCDSPEVAGFYRRAWGADSSLLRGLADFGGESALITDDAAVAEMGAAIHIALQVEGDHAVAASDVAETAFAQLFAVAAERFAAWNDGPHDAPRLLWVHARGFHGPWDAPAPLRAALLEEGDPPAPTFVTPPEHLSTADQDELLVHRAAYAAQVAALDVCLGGLLSVVNESAPDRDLLLAVVGCRGYALGEHGMLGSSCRSLYGETLHVPCLVKAPGRAPAPPRWGGLAHVSDLAAMLARWFDLPRQTCETDAGFLDGDDDGDAARRVIVAHGPNGERSLRTRDWYLRQPPGSGDTIGGPRGQPELYVKPDDRWEANEVADRCPEVVEHMLAVLDGLPIGISIAPAMMTADSAPAPQS